MAEGMRNADAPTVATRRRRGSRILAGIGAAVVVLAAAAYADDQSLQLRIEREVDARFAAIRTTLGSATHGRVQFDPWTRTIRIHDIALQGNPKVMPPVKIGELALVGMPLPPGDRITAWRVEMTGTEVAVDAFKTMRLDGLVIDDLDVSRAIDWQGLRDLAAGGGSVSRAGRCGRCRSRRTSFPRWPTRSRASGSGGSRCADSASAKARKASMSRPCASTD